MSKIPDHQNVSRRDFLAGAGTITTGYLVIGASSAPLARAIPAGKPDRVITFDATKTPIGCSIDPQPTAPPVDLCEFTVNINEVISFKAITSKTKHHLAVLFTGDTPFVDKNNKNSKVWAFHGSQVNEANDEIGKDAIINPSLSEDDFFECTIGIWDEDNLTTCTRDPTIMIGKAGQGLTRVIAALKAANELLQKAAAVPSAARADIQSIETSVSDLIAKIKKILAARPK